MKSLNFMLVALFAVVVGFSSCSGTMRTMREPNTRVNFTKSDFSLSDQVSAEASSTKILGIDWKRLFKKEEGSVEGGAVSLSLASIPVIGGFITDRTSGYALYEMMSKNAGYDVVFYPQYETKYKKPFLGLGFIYTKTTVKATARLGKLNK